MPAPAYCRSASLRLWGPLCLIVSSLAGCSNGPSAEQQVDAAFQANPEARLKVARFEGTVTIDGQAPGKDYPLLRIFLVEADKFQDPKHAQRWQAAVDESGHFAFATYLKNDGAPVGKYVALFIDPEATVHVKTARTVSGTGFGGPKAGPDKLKNLYNDPEQNIKDPAFVINLQQPGITDQQFDLKVAGKESPSSPGRYSVKDAPVASSVFKFGS
jgi:hypothetical protein